ncbi:MAG: M20 family metallopeptidase [Bradymonadaceae bacterium]
MSTFDAPARAPIDHVVDLRRDFHRHPELAFQERETAYDGVGSGVVGRLEAGPADGPVVAVRAEMDALPGSETTELPFASEIPDRMHTCGHDAHMAMVLGAAATLADDPPDGTVVFVFQPAEESGGGARTVLDSGHLDDVDAIFALHVTRHY